MLRLMQLTLNDDGFAFSPTTGDSFQVNRTALEILRGFQRGKAQNEISDHLTRTYGLSARDARRDVVDFEGRLRAFGLV